MGPWEGEAGAHRLVAGLTSNGEVIKENESNFNLEYVWLLFYIHNNCTNWRYVDFFLKNSVNYSEENN